MGEPSVPGFRAAGIHAGIKKDGRPDLALLVSDPPAKAAGIFTRNRVQSPSVLVTRRKLRSGLCRAVLINSGNANACTGERGIRDAENMCRRTARTLGEDAETVAVCSTGVIGEYLPMDRIRRALPRLVDAIRPEGLSDAAEAIRTTDRFPKQAWARATIEGRDVTLFGMAKGAGMICPNMATMLAYFLTDLKAPLPALRRLLREGAARSFNRINVDGDSSTNDTVLLLANGLANNRSAGAGSRQYDAFAAMLFPMMEELAFKIVQDGEGATKVVEIRVHGARRLADARRFAYRLANSSLVRTSFYGNDPNWGRLMAALGSAGLRLDPGKVDISYDDVQVVRRGASTGERSYLDAKEVVRKGSFTLLVNLHQGEETCSILASDLSHDYVTVNASYRS